MKRIFPPLCFLQLLPFAVSETTSLRAAASGPPGEAPGRARGADSGPRWTEMHQSKQCQRGETEQEKASCLRPLPSAGPACLAAGSVTLSICPRNERPLLLRAWEQRHADQEGEVVPMGHGPGSHPDSSSLTPTNSSGR